MGFLDFLSDAFEENAKRTTKNLSEKSGDDSIYEEWEAGKEARDDFKASLKNLFKSDNEK